MNSALQIPLMGGQQQDIDEAVMPDGVIAEVLNLRMNRAGAWVKRKPYVGLQIDTTQEGPVVALARLGEQQLVVAGAPPAVLQVQFDSAVRHFGNRFLPWFSAAQREPLVADLNNDVTSAGVAMASGWTVTVYTLDDAVHATVHRDSDGAIYQFDLFGTTGATDAQVVACGTNIVAVWHSSASGLVARVLDVSGTEPSWGGVIVLDATSNAGHSVTSLGSSLLFAHQRTSSTIRTELRAAPFTSATATDTQTVAGGVYNTAIDGATGEGVWVAWVNNTGEIGVVVMGADLSSPTGITSVSGVDTTLDDKISLARYSATSRVLAWGGFDTDVPYEGFVRFAHISNLAVAGTTRSRYGVRLMSRLFVVAGNDFDTAENFMFCVVVNDAETDAEASGGGGESTRTYFVLMFSDTSGVLQDDAYPFQAMFGVDLAAQPTDWLKIGTVASASGAHTFAGLTYMRGLPDSDPVVGLALWRFGSTGYDRCRPVEMHGALYFSGAIMSKWDGTNAYEAGWLLPTDIVRAVAANSTGALTPTGTYSYRVVLETTTQDGARVQSTPSRVATLTLGASDDTVTLSIRDMRIRSQYEATSATRGTNVHVYRTLANEAEFRRVTPASGLPVGELLTTSNVITYVDETSDADLAAGEILYTEGGILPHGPPPTCRFLARVGKRLWTGGGENPREFRCSKEFVGGEPVQFVQESNPDDPAFGMLISEPGTGIADLDGTPVLFARRAIYLVLGRGPDDLGSGEFELQRLPSDFGCTDHRLVATCAKGVLFRSTRGLELLARGQGEPVWIGRAVADLLDTYTEVTSVAVLERDQTVRWTAHDGAGNGVVLVWNMTYDVWSYYTDLSSSDAEYVLGAEWDGNHVVATEEMGDSAPIRLEQNSGVESTYTVSRMRLGHITLQCISKYYKSKSVVLNLRFQDDCDVVIEVEYDGDPSATDSHTFGLTGLTAGTIYPLEFVLPRQKVDRLQVTVYDTESLGTQGVEYLGLVLNYKPQRGHRRLAAAYRG